MKTASTLCCCALSLCLLAFTSILPLAAQETGNAPRTFRVEVTGEGPPMILIPGLASSGRIWDETVDREPLTRVETPVLVLLAGGSYRAFMPLDRAETVAREQYAGLASVRIEMHRPCSTLSCTTTSMA